VGQDEIVGDPDTSAEGAPLVPGLGEVLFDSGHSKAVIGNAFYEENRPLGGSIIQVKRLVTYNAIL
jgi:hypothetical protein